MEKPYDFSYDFIILSIQIGLLEPFYTLQFGCMNYPIQTLFGGHTGPQMKTQTTVYKPSLDASNETIKGHRPVYGICNAVVTNIYVWIEFFCLDGKM